MLRLLKIRAFKLVLFIVISFSIVAPATSSAAALDPRIKAIASMAAYGTIGGALLGTASLAFGASGRSVAQGASIGLYAGLVFGSYVVLSHALRDYEWGGGGEEDYYTDSFVEEPEEEEEEEEEYIDEEEDDYEYGEQRWRSQWAIHAKPVDRHRDFGLRKSNDVTLFYMDIVKIQF